MAPVTLYRYILLYIPPPAKLTQVVVVGMTAGYLECENITQFTE